MIGEEVEEEEEEEEEVGVVRATSGTKAAAPAAPPTPIRLTLTAAAEAGIVGGGWAGSHLPGLPALSCC